MGNRNAAGSRETRIKGSSKKALKLRSRRIKVRKAYDKKYPKGTLYARKK